MSDVRILPGQRERVETGIVQFGDDWPGIFIRGDNAFMYAGYIRTAMQTMNNTDAFYAVNLEWLADLLESCDTRSIAALAAKDRP